MIFGYHISQMLALPLSGSPSVKDTLNSILTQLLPAYLISEAWRIAASNTQFSPPSLCLTHY
jgi:hypothetical protein